MPEMMPDFGMARARLLPDDGTVYARTEGGLVVTARRSDPFWQGRMTTRALPPFGQRNLHAACLAFLSRVADRNISVDWVHPRHDLPMFYDETTWPMAGDGSLVAMIDAWTVSVAGLPAGLVLRVGDRLAIRQDDLIAHRWIAQDVTASGAFAQNISVTPRLPLGVLAPSAAVILKNPPMRFRVLSGSWQTEEARKATSVSFDVMEALR